jgi:hypothetical protein
MSKLFEEIIYNKLNLKSFILFNSDEEHALIAKLCNTLNDESIKVADNNKITENINEVT